MFKHSKGVLGEGRETFPKNVIVVKIKHLFMSSALCWPCLKKHATTSRHIGLSVGRFSGYS